MFLNNFEKGRAKHVVVAVCASSVLIFGVLLGCWGFIKRKHPSDGLRSTHSTEPPLPCMGHEERKHHIAYKGQMSNFPVTSPSSELNGCVEPKIGTQ